MSNSLTNSLIAQLLTYRTRFPNETPIVDRFLDFVQSGETLQGKVNQGRHITASAWIIDPSGTKALLTLHRKLGKWLQLGGHTEPGEDWLAAALREAHEESGLHGFDLASPGLFDLDIHEIPAFGQTPTHLHYDLRYLLRLATDQPLVVSDESHSLAWVELGRIGEYTTDTSQLRMVRKCLDQAA